jgi:hypothetical protein
MQRWYPAMEPTLTDILQQGLLPDLHSLDTEAGDR